METGSTVDVFVFSGRRMRYTCSVNLGELSFWSPTLTVTAAVPFNPSESSATTVKFQTCTLSKSSASISVIAPVVSSMMKGNTGSGASSPAMIIPLVSSGISTSEALKLEIIRYRTRSLKSSSSAVTCRTTSPAPVFSMMVMS